jgi:hypothetical protein
MRTTGLLFLVALIGCAASAAEPSTIQVIAWRDCSRSDGSCASPLSWSDVTAAVTDGDSATLAPDAFSTPTQPRWLMIGTPTPICGVRLELARRSVTDDQPLWVFCGGHRVDVLGDETARATVSGEVTWAAPEMWSPESWSPPISQADDSLFWAAIGFESWSSAGAVDVLDLSPIPCP